MVCIKIRECVNIYVKNIWRNKMIIAMLSGTLMSIQGVWNTQVTKVCGLWVTNMWVQFTALLTCVCIWFYMGRDTVTSLLKVEPRYLLAGGILGAGITWTVIKSIESLGPAKAALFIVVTQIIVSYIIELFGVFQVEKTPFEWKKLLGIGITLIGLWVFHYGEK